MQAAPQVRKLVLLVLVLSGREGKLGIVEEVVEDTGVEILGLIITAKLAEVAVVQATWEDVFRMEMRRQLQVLTETGSASLPHLSRLMFPMSLALVMVGNRISQAAHWPWEGTALQCYPESTSIFLHLSLLLGLR